MSNNQTNKQTNKQTQIITKPKFSRNFEIQIQLTLHISNSRHLDFPELFELSTTPPLQV